MQNNDWRTDNWAGYIDYNSRHHYQFPRSAREAGFYYGPTQDDGEPGWYIFVVIMIIVGGLYWLG